MPRVLTETKHFQAAGKIRELINRMAPGEVLPVVSELVVKLELSHGTTIRALKVLADEGVIYRPFGRQRYVIPDRFERVSARISLIRPDYPTPDLDNIIAHIHAEGQKRNWKFNQFCFRKKDELDFVHIVRESDAIVLLPTSEFLDDAFVRALLKPARPVVVLLQHVNHPQINNITVNDFRVGEIAAETLFAKGHRRILLLKDQPAETTMAERLAGFRSKAEQLGIESAPELYLDTRIHSFEDPLDAAYSRMTELLKKKISFTAVFTLSLSGALASQRALREAGYRIPQDVALLGYGGESRLASYLYPPLSTIDIDCRKFGEYTAELLCAALERPGTPPGQKSLEPYLVERESI